ncbi:MAG: biotin-dependent carboxyltransferase family protein [Paracoccus sp. (in: a-proteobacteria)]|uniref:5-oxoprolinase subunit C family protein n=1 Tax=Paracoccus sp. TaxID=267 RepID=UPI0039E6E4FA
MLKIIGTPPLNSVQDHARPGYRDIGLVQGGAMDDLALSLGNALLGNPDDAAGIEVQTFPLRLTVTEPHPVAVTGAAAAFLDGAALPPCWAVRVRPGQELLLKRGSGARGYVTVAGGIDVPLVLGSRATDLRNGFGGHEGRDLRAGDPLPVGPSANAPRAQDFGTLPPWQALAFTDAPDPDVLHIRVVAGPEHDGFDATSRDAFWQEEWAVSTMTDRMGIRLSGARQEGGRLMMERPKELRSGGILPGVVQVPPSGEPLIQLRDANGAGGYPRIGVVIRADMWRAGQARPGTRLRFHRVTPEEAIEAAHRKQRLIDELRRDVARYAELPGFTE